MRLITFFSPPLVHVPCKTWIPIQVNVFRDTDDDLGFNYLENYSTCLPWSQESCPVSVDWIPRCFVSRENCHKRETGHFILKIDFAISHISFGRALPFT